MERDELLRQLSFVIEDQRVLDAMRIVPREVFVPGYLREWAWDNEPQPIGNEQTISQPLVVARMCELLELEGDETILDVGGGSGYHAALLAQLGRRVISIEQHADLAEAARASIAEAGIENVEIIVGDGSRGLPDRAPFDAINVAATARREAPPALVEQLAEGGRMVIPVGRDTRLNLIRRSVKGITTEQHEPVRFVPLVQSSFYGRG
ncbi:MAG: protein-L-isoaspartate(D-aspartate) O-methyltransferase [Thermoleophilia bacterium]|nr:protein-L-isoaspartate(D-aspartate) O-methyltransferase [Thermoleophilia bacterium]